MRRISVKYYVFILVSFCSTISCQNHESAPEKQEIVEIIKGGHQDSTWFNMNNPKFSLNKYREKFKFKNTILFEVSLSDSEINLEKLSEAEFYSCFQEMTTGYLPKEEEYKLVYKKPLEKDEFYFYSVQPSFESYGESFHSFTTYLCKSSLNEVSIQGVFHCEGQKVRTKSEKTTKFIEEIGLVSSFRQQFYELALDFKSDTFTRTVKTEILPSISGKDLGAPYFKTTEVTNNKLSGEKDSIIKILHVFPWDYGVHIDGTKFKNGELIEGYENLELRKKLKY